MSDAVKFWFLFLLSAILFFAPLATAERIGFGMDKVVHFFLFAGLAVLGVRSYPRQKVAVMALLLIYTVGSEYLQGEYIPFRSFDVYDILADTLGLLGGTVYLQFSRHGQE